MAGAAEFAGRRRGALLGMGIVQSRQNQEHCGLASYNKGYPPACVGDKALRALSPSARVSYSMLGRFRKGWRTTPAPPYRELKDRGLRSR